MYTSNNFRGPAQFVQVTSGPKSRGVEPGQAAHRFGGTVDLMRHGKYKKATFGHGGSGEIVLQ
jgi:hypothetical protein